MKQKTGVMLFLVILLLLVPVSAFAQQDSFSIRLTRDNGYGGLNNDIQGTFSIKTSGPDTLDSVNFYIDEELIGSLSSSPYNLQFHTGNYPDGSHRIYAVGVLADGSELISNEIVVVFISGEAAMQSTLKLVTPILALVALLTVGSSLLQASRKKKHGAAAVGNYGMAGGAVCNKCMLPFSRNFLSPNLVIGKLSRCPHCGKWQIARRAFGTELNLAEDRLKQELNASPEISSTEPEKEFEKMVQDSRFEE